MDTIYFNQQLSDDERRERLYKGQIFVYSARPSTQALVQLARDLCEEMFAPHDPREAQHHLDLRQYVEILATLKPRFIHHPSIEPENTMTFYPKYWSQRIRNSSDEFNYQDWTQTGRKAAPKLVKADTRKQSAALEPVDPESQLRPVIEAGGLIIFSAAHLHATVPNTSGVTRLSIDFRTVHLEELPENRGAPNLDSACGGTTIRDYLRGTDLAHVPEDVCATFESG